jgi:hypothetical protein
MTQDTGPKPDWFYRSLVAGLLVVAVWLLAMPWVPAIARSTMQRFHLRTDSFTAWAIQQPIPPMYSFANTTEVRNQPPASLAYRSPAARGVIVTEATDVEPASPSDLAPAAVVAGRMINHFPTREFTFANARVRYLRDGRSKWFVLRSRYRGQTVESIYRLEPSEGPGWTATLIEPQDSTGGDGS